MFDEKKSTQAKKSVLEEIMQMMDNKMSDGLKNHPKIMAAKIEVAKPEVIAVDEPSLDEDDGDKVEDSSPEKEEMDPEEMQKLLELYKQLKD